MFRSTLWADTREEGNEGRETGTAAWLVLTDFDALQMFRIQWKHDSDVKRENHVDDDSRFE